MTLTELRTALRQRLGVPSSDAYFTDAVCTSLVNQGLHLLESEADWPWLEAKETIATVNGTESYSPASNWVRTIAVKGADGYSLKRVSIEDIDEDNGTSGNPRRYAVIEQKLYVRPTPTAAVNLTHRYIRSESDLSGDSDQPLVPAQYHTAIVEAAASFGFRRRYKLQDAEAANGSYNAFVAAMKKRLDPGGAQDGADK